MQSINIRSLRDCKYNFGGWRSNPAAVRFIAFAALRLCGRSRRFSSRSLGSGTNTFRKGTKPQRPFFLCLILLAGCLGVAVLHGQRSAQAANENGKPPVDAKTAAIDQALFTRAEFFGTQALVPFPTAEARSRLAALQATYPNDPQIDLKLAQLDEKLGRKATLRMKCGLCRTRA